MGLLDNVLMCCDGDSAQRAMQVILHARQNLEARAHGIEIELRATGVKLEVGQLGSNPGELADLVVELSDLDQEIQGLGQILRKHRARFSKTGEAQ